MTVLVSGCTTMSVLELHPDLDAVLKGVDPLVGGWVDGFWRGV
jgi:hypothetical protein